jgi:hypothetical protein
MYLNIFKSPYRKTTQILTSSMTHCMQKPINSALHRRFIKVLFRPLRRIKSFSIFPSPAGMSLTQLSMGGNNDVKCKLFPPRVSLARDIPAWDGNIEKLFYGVGRKQKLRILFFKGHVSRQIYFECHRCKFRKYFISLCFENLYLSRDPIPFRL